MFDSWLFAYDGKWCFGIKLILIMDVFRRKIWRIFASGEAGHLATRRTLRPRALKLLQVCLNFFRSFVLSVFPNDDELFDFDCDVDLGCCRSSWSGYCKCRWFGTCREALGCSVQQTWHGDCWPLYVSFTHFTRLWFEVKSVCWTCNHVLLCECL